MADETPKTDFALLANAIMYSRPKEKKPLRNRVLTASRQNCYLACQRRHFLRYEMGFAADETSAACSFGSAWHRGMEARWKGFGAERALLAALGPDGADGPNDQFEVAKLSALLAGYFKHWGETESFGTLHPEQPFEFPMHDDAFPVSDWSVAGKMDVLGATFDGRQFILESKTTSSDIDSDSDYWLRLRLNVQLMQYLDASIRAGWSVDLMVYDVTRKPALKPKQTIPVLDEDGLKIVLDANGDRALREVGKAKKKVPYQSANKKLGYVMQVRSETTDEFFDRVFEAVTEEPDKYFVRREVPILEEDLVDFRVTRDQIVRQIEENRKTESWYPARPELAWPRDISKANCKFCEFQGPCLQNVHINPDLPPQGLSVKPINEELYEPTPDEVADDAGTA